MSNLRMWPPLSSSSVVCDPFGAIKTPFSTTVSAPFEIQTTSPRTRTRRVPATSFKVNFNKSFSVNSSYTYLILNVEGERLYTVNALDASIKYQFDQRMFLRAIIQYTDVDRNLDLYEIDVEGSESTWFTQLLFSYKLNPRTVLFLGYTDNYLGNQDFSTLQTDRTVFAKIGYAWTM